MFTNDSQNTLKDVSFVFAEIFHSLSWSTIQSCIFLSRFGVVVNCLSTISAEYLILLFGKYMSEIVILWYVNVKATICHLDASNKQHYIHLGGEQR